MDSCKRGLLCAALLVLAGTAQATTQDGKVDQQMLGTVDNQQFGSLLNLKGDFNHDGIADLVVGSPAGPDMRGAVDIFYGKAKGVAQQAKFHYEGPMAWAQVGASPVVADVNGDGYPDLIVGASNYSGAQQYAGAVLVFPGKEKGLSAEPKIIEGPSTNSFFGFRIRSLGDFNHDGYDDIAVGAMGANGNLGQIYIYKGGPKGLKKKPLMVLAGQAPWQNFGQMFDVGDVNGDGVADLIVGANSFVGGIPSMTWIYHGSVSGFASTPEETLFAPASVPEDAWFGSNVTFLGDVDGDGFGDLAVGAPRYADGTSSGMALVFYGGANGPSGSGRVQTITAGNDKMLFMGDNLLGQRDVNGDGYMDLVVGTSNFARPNDPTEPFPGGVWIYRGGASGLDTQHVYKLNGPKDTRAEYGMSLEVGDVNGDGTPDLLTGSGVYTDTINQQGVVRVFFGVPK